MKRTYHNHDIEDYIDYHDIRYILYITTYIDVSILILLYRYMYCNTMYCDTLIYHCIVPSLMHTNLKISKPLQEKHFKQCYYF